MKIKKSIPDIQCHGRIKAEGKKASFPFCYREKVLRTDQHGKQTGIELYSRIHGELIGYFGRDGKLVSDPADAEVLDHLNAFQVPMRMKFFMMDAAAKRSKSIHPQHSAMFKEKANNLKAIIKAAKAKPKPAKK